MDKVYNIISGTINIDKQRAVYTGLYDHVRVKLLDGLKNYAIFKQLFHHVKLCGSYADNLKISAPDEFDLVMRLRFPEANLVKIIYDHETKGNVKIDLTDLLAHLKGDNKSVNLYNFLYKCVNKECFLLENKIQQWLQSCFDKVLCDIKENINFNGEQYKLSYSRQGPAHTITVQNINTDKPTLSIDFVPGFAFSSLQSVSKREPTEYWEAIPRPLKNSELKDNPSFRTSYTESERKILTDKRNMKTALRLMKKFRDNNPALCHLKSYYIKTLFLWIDFEKNATFWKEPVYEIIREVFRKLEEALLNEEIKFFWDNDLNLLKVVKRTQINAMRQKVQQARKTTCEPLHQKHILKLYLTNEEINALADGTMAYADSMESGRGAKYLFYSIFGLYCVILCYQLYRVITQKPDLSI